MSPSLFKNGLSYPGEEVLDATKDVYVKGMPSLTGVRNVKDNKQQLFHGIVSIRTFNNLQYLH